MDIKCPICGSADVKCIGELVSYPAAAVYCGCCNCYFPSVFPGDEEIRKYYQGFAFNRPPSGRWAARIIRAIFAKKCRNIKKIIQKYHAGLELLDFGGGCGLYARGFMDVGFQVNMVEVDEQAAFIAAEMGVNVSGIGSIKEYDIIFSSHVIEHYKDLHGYFDTLYKLAKPDGIAIIACPNKDAKEFYRIEHALGYKNTIKSARIRDFIANPWWCLDPPRHFYALSSRSLRFLAAQHGFSVVEEFTEFSTRSNFCHNDMYSICRLSSLKRPMRLFYKVYVNIVSWWMSIFFKDKMFGENLVIIIKKLNRAPGT